MLWWHISLLCGCVVTACLHNRLIGTGVGLGRWAGCLEERVAQNAMHVVVCAIGQHKRGRYWVHPLVGWGGWRLGSSIILTTVWCWTFGLDIHLTDPCLPMSTNLNLHFVNYIHSAGCAHCVDCIVVAVTILLPISTLLRVVVMLAIPIL